MAAQESRDEPKDSTNPPQQPGGGQLALVMVGLCLAVFLTGMDQTILATATPVISNEFNTIQDLGWWSNAYLLTLSSFQLFYGKLYSLFPIKIVYLVAIVLFEIGSLVCTTAPNSVALIIGRAIAGLGAAGVFSGGILITTKLIPLAKRAAYLGIMSAAFGLAAIVGPFLGGALIAGSTWRWCFGINLPLGVVTVVLSAFFVRTPSEPEIRNISLQQKLQELDVPGTVFIVAGLICLLMALQWGGSAYPWSNGRIIALFIVAGVLLIAFVVSQVTLFTGRARTIPTSCARNRDVWLAATYAMCITGSVYIAILFLPLWFQTVRDYSPLSSGTMITPLIAGYVVCSVVAGGLTGAIGYYNPGMIIGTALAVVGSVVLTTISLDSSTARIVGFQLLFGFGVGFGFGQPSYVIQTVLPAVDVPIGVTFITLVQNLSASVFVAVAQSVFQGQLRARLQILVPDLDVSKALGSGAADILKNLPLEIQGEAREAFSESIIRTFYIALALSCLSVVGAFGVKWGSMKQGEKESVEIDGSAQRQVLEHPDDAVTKGQEALDGEQKDSKIA